MEIGGKHSDGALAVERLYWEVQHRFDEYNNSRRWVAGASGDLFQGFVFEIYPGLSSLHINVFFLQF
jgi:hypothetical protein